MLDWENTALWEQSDWFVTLPDGHYGNVWLRFHQVVDLSVSVEEHDTGFHHVLEDEVLVIVTAFENVTHDQVIEDRFPLGSYFVSLSKVVDLLLSDLCIENLLVHAGSKIGGNSTLCILDKERLILLV